MAEKRKFSKALTVTSCELKHQGTSQKTGRPWAIYEVHAVDDGGQPVEEKLKSFDNCILNELITYEIEEENHEKYGRSYSLRPPRDKRGPSPAAASPSGVVDEKLFALEQRIARLEAMVPGGQPATVQAAATGQTEMQPTRDEDIPF